ncbi:MAG: hypothetical protein LBS46_04745 [Dysgonamonadaceae bacterium]|nr:hypothetical protein [Dysgonamonadaceae bacterium]
MEKKQYVSPGIILYRVAMEKGIADTVPVSIQGISAQDWENGGTVGAADADLGDLWLPLN